MRKLLRQKWIAFNKSKLKNIENVPGVYVLGYTARKSFTGTLIKMEDIFYVGMSATSLRLRLNQFLDGIEDGGHHSGAKRFFWKWAAGRPFSKLKTDNKFYVATLPLECNPKKGLRSSGDLEQLGIVASLEYFVLARIKKELDLEPPINKK